jgi:Leucine-rich repeat (LRR) protein
MNYRLLTFILLFFYSATVYPQCSTETYQYLGDFNFDELQKEENTGRIFGIIYVSDTLELGGETYISQVDSMYAKVVAELDNEGNLLNSFLVDYDYEYIAESFNNGYRNAGFTLDQNHIYIPSIYLNESGRLIYNVQAYDFNGNIVWSKDFPASIKRGVFYGFDENLVRQNGNLLISGSFADTLNIDSQQFVNIEQSTGFLLELNPNNGDFINFTQILGSNQMEFYNLKEDLNRNLYVAGNIYNADSVVVNGNTINYTGLQSGHIFKLDNSNVFQWVRIFESDFGLENFPLHIDESNGYIHYAAVHYESGGGDNTTTDAWIGALDMTDGSTIWEHEMASTNWYYLAYDSWFDDAENAIYLPIWVNNGGINQIYMDGELLQDSISSRTILHKFSADGNSEWISPIRFSSSKSLIDRGDGTILSAINYSSTPGTRETVGIIDPANYPQDWVYLDNNGGNTVGNAELVVASSGNPINYQWYYNGDSIVDATDSIFTPTEVGSYWVDVENESNCISRSHFIGINPGNNSQADSLALVELYQATGGGNWNDSTGWLSAPLADWYGIQINGEGRVTNIDLNSNNLSGILPSSFRDLTAIEEIFLYNNINLTINFENLISGKNNLRRLRAHDCNITGNIPSELTQFFQLTDIALQNNSITGSIPNDIGNLTALTELDLNSNNLEGSIPTSIGQLVNLNTLNLSNNDLGNELPIEMENLESLTYIDLNSNNFTGTFPDLIHLPNIQAIYVYSNAELITEIPNDLDQLTQLRSYHIDGTKPIGGEIPQVIFDATFMESYGISGHNFTGSLTEENITQLSNLSALYISFNLLTGALPEAFVNLDSLRILNISNNNFTSLPDFSASNSMRELVVFGNQFQFSDLIPNYQSDFDIFNYAPQKPIGNTQNIEASIGSTQEINSEIAELENSNYQWLINGDTLSNATNISITVEDFSTAKSGRYLLRSTHPEIPDLVLNSAPINLKIAGGKTNWYIDNRAGTIADFRDLSQAINATNSGDTLYIAGSNTQYTGGIIDGLRVIIGPGYFLEENPNTQFNTLAAEINFIDLSATADGSRIYGVSTQSLRLNNQSSSAPDTLKNIVVAGNRLQTLSFNDKNFNITVQGNIIGGLQFASTTVQNVNRSYDDFTVSNNIIDTISTFFDIISTEKSSLDNMVFDFNTIRFISDGINNLSFSNSIIGELGNGFNNFENNIEYDEGLFTNSSGNFTVDNDYIPIDGSLPQGAFAGDSPYKLSGLPPVPSIYNIEIGERLSAKLNVKSNNENNITRIRYLYRRNNQSSSPFNVNGFDISQDLEVEFLPNRSSIQPNETYDLIFVAIDESGKRSHRTYIPYEAIAANLSGDVVDIDKINVTEGKVRLFAINPYANKYDTAAVQALNGSNTFNFENLILGDYIILADPDETEFPNLIPTYLGNTLDWQLADTIFLQNNTSNVTIEVEKEPAPLTDPGSEISGFIEEEFENADTTLRVLPRKRVSGVGVSVRVLTGSSRPEGSLRLLDEDYELITYIRSDENGEFTFPNLPSGDYRIRVEYPGVEVDETSDINFNLTGESGEVINLEALVEDGKVKITETGRVTANAPEKSMVFRFYPNPVKSELNLMLENARTANELIIFDLKGVIYKRIKLTNGQTTIDLEHLDTGTYILRLQDINGNYMMSKMIKK